MTATKPGYKTSEVYVAGTTGTALATGLAYALEAGQQTAAIGCALAMAYLASRYTEARAKAKGAKS